MSKVIATNGKSHPMMNIWVWIHPEEYSKSCFVKVKFTGYLLQRHLGCLSVCKDTISDLRNHSVWRRDGVSASWTSTMVPLKVWEWLWTSICWATLQPQQTLVVRIREQGSKGQRRCSESMVVSELNKEKGGCSRWGRKKVTGESKKMCTRDSKNIGLPGVKERDCRVTKISLNNS